MSSDWNIRPCERVCRACGQPFADGQAIYSRLVFGAEGYARADFDELHWNDEARAGAVSFWKSVFRAPPAKPDEPLKKETAETLLRQFMTREDFSRKNVIYILAVMLERKRILVEKDVQVREDGAKIRIYEHRGTGETFVIPDPGLKLAELEHVQQEVVVLLGGKPPGSPPPAPSTESAADAGPQD